MSHTTESLATALADRYRIERGLGAGGMATVYLARDLKHDRDVAIKIMRPELAHAVGAERFGQEIRMVARLNHPHILPLHDSGEIVLPPSPGRSAPEPVLYYVMPVMEGQALRERLRAEKRLPLEEGIRIACEVADALDHAHRMGVVHRDIKPENILLHEGHALVADFGIGKAVATLDGGEDVTWTGLVVGTPAYMSPEQAAGREVDGRTDLYALGCVLHEMLTGVTPRARRVGGGTDPKSEGELPRGMARVLQRMLELEPADRVGSGAECIALLRDAVAKGLRTAPDERSVAVLPFANMSPDPEDAFLADGISEEIINALAQLPGLRVAARASAFSFKGKQEDLRVVGEKLNVATILDGSVRHAGDRLRITAQLINVADGLHLWSERYDRQLTDVFAIQDEIAGTIAAELKVTLTASSPATDGRPVRAGAPNLEAYRLFLKGRALVSQRGPALAEGVAVLERAVALDPDNAPALAALANGLTFLGIFGTVRPAEALPRARMHAARAVALDPALAEARMVSAMLAAAEGERATARQEWELAAERGPRNAELQSARALWDLAYLHGAFDVAVDHGHRAAAMDPLSAYARANLALLLAHAGRAREGLLQARRAVELDPAGYLPALTLERLLFYAGEFAEGIVHGEALARASARHVWSVGELA
ncbi:MAG: protein kinase, partial [Gemmatimonadota bacterium]|nr:protein kinase [Gemmatimonadota bacterium]